MFVVFTLIRGEEVFNAESDSFVNAYGILRSLQSAGVKSAMRAYRQTDSGTECYQPTEYGGTVCRIG